MLKNPFAQAAVMVVVAILVAVTTNSFASRQRKLVLPGYYPNALRVPPRVPATVPPPPITETAASETAQSPAPGQPRMEIPTSTIERPAGDASEVTPIVPMAGDPRQTAMAAPAAPAPAPSPAAPPLQDPMLRFQPQPDRAAVDISGADAALLHSRGALFLDARRTAVFVEGHIAGARPYSVWESDIDQKINALFAERSDPHEQNLPIVIYCSGGECEDSHMLAEKLWGIQFNNIYVYKDGYPDWLRRGGAVRKGAQP
jgi:rhodanese-related sulfurtransferase